MKKPVALRANKSVVSSSPPHSPIVVLNVVKMTSLLVLPVIFYLCWRRWFTFPFNLSPKRNPLSYLSSASGTTSSNGGSISSNADASLQKISNQKPASLEELDIDLTTPICAVEILEKDPSKVNTKSSNEPHPISRNAPVSIEEEPSKLKLETSRDQDVVPNQAQQASFGHSEPSSLSSSLSSVGSDNANLPQKERDLAICRIAVLLDEEPGLLERSDLSALPELAIIQQSSMQDIHLLISLHGVHSLPFFAHLSDNFANLLRTISSEIRHDNSLFDLSSLLYFKSYKPRLTIIQTNLDLFNAVLFCKQGPEALPQLQPLLKLCDKRNQLYQLLLNVAAMAVSMKALWRIHPKLVDSKFSCIHKRSLYERIHSYLLNRRNDYKRYFDQLFRISKKHSQLVFVQCTILGIPATLKFISLSIRRKQISGPTPFELQQYIRRLISGYMPYCSIANDLSAEHGHYREKLLEFKGKLREIYVEAIKSMAASRAELIKKVIEEFTGKFLTLIPQKYLLACEKPSTSAMAVGQPPPLLSISPKLLERDDERRKIERLRSGFRHYLKRLKDAGEPNEPGLAAGRLVLIKLIKKQLGILANLMLSRKMVRGRTKPVIRSSNGSFKRGRGKFLKDRMERAQKALALDSDPSPANVQRIIEAVTWPDTDK